MRGGDAGADHRVPLLRRPRGPRSLSFARNGDTLYLVSGAPQLSGRCGSICDLDGGLSFKGTLKGVPFEALQAGMPVRLVFDDAGGAVDGDGHPYVGFHFVAGDAS